MTSIDRSAQIVSADVIGVLKLTVSIQYWRVTDRQTNRHLATA